MSAIPTASAAVYAATPFDPIPEFQGKQAWKNFESNLRDLCINARIAFSITGQTKAKLIESSTAASNETVTDIAERLRDAAESCNSLLEIIESAETRYLIVLANRGQS